MFGQFAFSTHMTPQRFAELAPHLQTEALLLATETGLSVPVVAAAIAIPAESARRMMTQRHFYVTPSSAVASWNEPNSIDDVRSNKMKVLSMLVDRGGAERVSLSLDEIAEGAEIAARSAPRAMRELAMAGLVVCLKRGANSSPAVYRVTEDGIEAARLARVAR